MHGACRHARHKHHPTEVHQVVRRRAAAAAAAAGSGAAATAAGAAAGADAASCAAEATEPVGVTATEPAAEPARYLRDWHLARDHPAESEALYRQPEVSSSSR